MRKLLLLFAFVIAGNFAIAQANANEAKAAYLLAEESYSKADYKGAMDYLQQVKTSLGSTNCKILYLEVMVARELYPKDMNGLGKVLAIIEAFEKSPDYKNFNEEKSLEISKVKLMTKSAYNQLKQKADSIQARKLVFEKPFNEIYTRFGPLGITPAKLDSLHPELKLLEWRTYPNTTTRYPSWVEIDPTEPARTFPFCDVTTDDFKNKISSIAFYRDSGKLAQYRSVLVYADKNVNKKSFPEALLEIDKTIQAYREKLGFTPASKETVLKDKGIQTWYQWELNGKVINLYKLSYPNNNPAVAKLMEVLWYSAPR